jgi:hypothetical protein
MTSSPGATKMWRYAGIGLFLVIVAVVLAIASLYTFSKPQHMVALGTPVHQDDFVFTVTGVGRASEISNKAASAKANGIFYIVSIRVDNNAQRVSFIWDEHIPHIVDASGQRWDISREAQAALDASLKPSFAIAAHDSRTFEAIFDVPPNTSKPVLVFDNGILMGDVFNLVAYRRIGVILY